MQGLNVYNSTSTYNLNNITFILIISNMAESNFSRIDHCNKMLLYAIENEIEELLQPIIGCGADVNAIDENGRTALFKAVLKNNENMVETLIECGADLNVADNETGGTVLFYAVGKENEQMVEKLINRGAHINATDQNGKTTLFYAVENGNEKMVKKLIECGADVNATDGVNRTALFYAVARENEQMVEKLINCGAHINATDQNGKTAIFYAADNESEKMVEKLIELGTEINHQDKQGVSALFYAVDKERGKIVVKLIECGADVNATDRDGTTVLFYAVNKENEEMVKILIGCDADVNFIDENGRTPLFYAVAKENEQMVEKLINCGARINATDQNGKTILFYAVENENETMVRKLIECGADVNAADRDGRTVLFKAVIKNNGNMVETLIKCDADLNVADNETGGTVLFYAVAGEYEQMVEKLINCGAHINVTDQNGKTTLFYAVENENETMVKKLIECGADVNATDRDGRTVLFKAVIRNNENMVETLIKCGADLNVADNETGGTVLFYAVAKENEQMVEKLINRGAHINAIEKRGKTALFYAVQQSNNESVVRALIAAGANVNITDNEGKTALFFVNSLDDPCPMTRILIENGVQVDQKDHYGRMALFYAMERSLSLESRDALELPRLLIKLGANPNTTDSDGNTAFHHATQLAFHGVTQESVMEICQQLETLNVSCHITNHQNETPLLYCLTRTIEKVFTEEEPWPAVNTQAAVCRFLVEHGSSVEAKNGSGETVLHLTVKLLQQGFFTRNSELRKDVSDVALELLEVIALAFRKQDCSTNTQDNSGNTPLHLWAKLELPPDYSNINTKEQNFKELVRTSLDLILRDRQEQLNSKNRNGETPLHLCRNCSAVEFLLNAGVNPNDVDSLGRTRLHYCCRNIVEASKSLSIEEIKATVHWSMIKLLRSHGADYRITDGDNQSCLDIAWEFPAIKELLKGPIDLDRLPVRIKPWKSVSKKHERCLDEVARHLESEHLESYWYHKDQLASGSFGDVFAGINEKDGREVAIKRMVKKSIVRPEDKREIQNLTALADCEQAVHYVHYFEDKNFSYIVLELAEGNLDELLDNLNTITENIRVQLCKDVVKGLEYLHNQNILHRDLKSANILYKLHPKLCLKIADFGLSRCVDSTSTTVYGTNAGTRCWIAPEVLTSTKPHSKSSDMFACGLVLHYILSVKTHPFARRGALQHEIEANILKGNMEGWDDSLCPEAAHLVKAMLDGDECKRPSADKALDHPLFWSKKKKLDLFIAVGNQPEFQCPRAKRTLALTAVETDLEKSFGTIVKYGDWNDPHYVQMAAIYTEMTRKRKYDTHSVVELVRFIRNAHAHVTALPKPIQDQLLKHYVFLEYFPNLVMEVYKAVTTHGWDQAREEIEHALR